MYFSYICCQNKLNPKSRRAITGTVLIMRRFLTILSAVVLFTFTSCNKITEGDITRMDYDNPSSYKALEISNAFEAYVSDNADVITITAGENVMPYVVVETVDNTLKIYLKPITIVDISELKVILPYNANLTSINLSGASEFHSEYGLKGEKVKVEMSGASEFYCDIEADEIDMNLSGASNIEGNVTATELDLDLSGSSNTTLIGEVTKLDIEMSGASDIKKTMVGNRYGLVCDDCQGEMSGASDAYIHCDGTIKVDLSGASNLHFTGTAFTGDCTTTGGSDIIHDVL